MTESQAVTVRPISDTSVLLKPKDVVNAAAEQAKALMDIVDQKKLYKQVEDNKYLKVEAWQLMAAFNNAHFITEYTKPVYEGEKIIAYEAKVNLVKDGEILSSGIMACGLEEFVTQGKAGYAKHIAAQSMAQTRGESKAGRMVYSHIAVLAGYQPTPAEEMENEEAPEYGICPECDISWQKFVDKKTGKTWYSHKKSDGTWCNKSKIDAQLAKATKDTAPTDKTPPAASSAENNQELKDWSKVDQSEYFAELDRVILDKGFSAPKVKEIMKPFNYTKRTEITIAKRNEVLRALMEFK